MKVCKTCGKEKPLSEFSNNGTYKGKKKFKPECTVCETKTRRIRFLAIAEDVFGELKCSKCGYNRCKAALDFHHVNESTKEIKPTQLVYYSEAKIRKELNKCIILCACCHREHHNGM